MIEKLSLRNFQAHESLDVELDPYVTTIIGRSDVGKSAIVRALRWICTNKPGGTSFVRHGSDQCKVIITIAGKVRVIRVRSQSTNYYKLNTSKFVSFGASVPSSISHQLNIDELNFQRQLDPPFWFSLSPGEVSRELNSIINLGLIDKTLTNVNAEFRKAKSTYSICNERLEKARLKKESLTWTEEANNELVRLEEIEESIKEIENRTQLLTRLINNSDVYINNKNQLFNACQEGKRVLSIGERLNELARRYTILFGLCNSIHTQQNIIQSGCPSAEEVNSINRISTRIAAKRTSIESLRQITQRLQVEKEEAECAVKQITNLERKLENSLKGKCPLCGQKISK